MLPRPRHVSCSFRAASSPVSMAALLTPQPRIIAYRCPSNPGTGKGYTTRRQPNCSLGKEHSCRMAASPSRRKMMGDWKSQNRTIPGPHQVGTTPPRAAGGDDTEFAVQVSTDDPPAPFHMPLYHRERMKLPCLALLSQSYWRQPFTIDIAGWAAAGDTSSVLIQNKIVSA